MFINERRYLPDASRRRLGRKTRRIERCVKHAILAGIADGSIERDANARLAMRGGPIEWTKDNHFRTRQ